jgi:hypothetical protein
MDYSDSMINKQVFFKAGPAGFVCGAALLAALTGCVGYVDGPRAGVYVAPPVVEVAAPADYIYYPGYDVYYNSSLNQYAYLDGGVWVSRPEPRGVSIDVLLASPSVRMDFHDSPANHHAEMARQYPRNWTPSGGHQVEKAHMERISVQKTQVAKAPVAKAQIPKAQVKKTTPKTEKTGEHDAHGEK